jgi:ribosome assembly protein SQT1
MERSQWAFLQICSKYSFRQRQKLITDLIINIHHCQLPFTYSQVLLAGSIADATVWMYHLPTSKCLQVFVGHECNGEGGGVTSGSFTPDGKFALTIGMDGTLRIWAPRTGMCRHVFKLTDDDDEMGPAGLTCLAVDGGADGQLAIAGGENGNAYVVHLQGKKLVGTLRHFDANSNGKANADSEQMVITSVEAVGFASKTVNPNWVATGGSDGILKIWDLTTEGQCRQTCSIKDEGSVSTGGVTKIFWHPTQPIIFVSYTDGAVRLWDARTGKVVHTLTGGKQDNQINDIAVEVFGTDQGPGSAIVITAHDDGTAKVFKVDVAAVLSQSQQI